MRWLYFSEVHTLTEVHLFLSQCSHVNNETHLNHFCISLSSQLTYTSSEAHPLTEYIISTAHLSLQVIAPTEPINFANGSKSYNVSKLAHDGSN